MSGGTDATPMLIRDNRRMRAAGCELAEAAMRVVREYDGLHRLSLAVAKWSEAVANEGDRPHAAEQVSSPPAGSHQSVIAMRVLLGQTLSHGDRWAPVRTWIESAMLPSTERGVAAGEARTALTSSGLRLVSFAEGANGREIIHPAEASEARRESGYLAVAYSSDCTAAIRTQFNCSQELALQLLAVLDGAMASKKIRFGGRPERAVMIPLRLLRELA